MDLSLLATSKAPTMKPFSAKGKATTLYASSAMPQEGVHSIGHRTGFHQFLGSLNEAFDKHLGFVLAPQQLFLLILQQVSVHVNENAEVLRDEFVKHAGKARIEIEVPLEPEWAEIIKKFQAEITDRIVQSVADLSSLKEFSCSSETEQIAGKVCLMDICQQYFQYEMLTLCGIPSFVLEGTVEDWSLLRARAESLISQKTLPDFACEWLPALLPTLDKLVEARSGAPVDVPFWNSFFKRGGNQGSGSYTYISGWVNVFFPISSDDGFNSGFNGFCESFERSSLYLSQTGTATTDESGNGIDYFPSGISRVPVKWNRLGTAIHVEFSSGFVCGSFNEGHIRPEVAWWVASHLP